VSCDVLCAFAHYRFVGTKRFEIASTAIYASKALFYGAVVMSVGSTEASSNICDDMRASIL